MSIGKETFGLTKKDYSERLSRIIANHRLNALLIGEPREFILRSCRLTTNWSKLASDPEVKVFLRNVEIASGRKVKLISLERGDTRQPVSKSKLIDQLYPPKQIKTSATPEEKHYNAVKRSMRDAVVSQLKEFRESVPLPCECYLSGRKINRGTKTDVDHVGLSFSEIADNFLRDRGLRYTDISLIGPPTAKRFRDKSLWEDWNEYHREKARYALVYASANRSKGNEGYQTPEELYGSFVAEHPEEVSLDF